MTIRHDRSASSIVSTCTRCPGIWFSFAFTIEDARARGERHDKAVHGDTPRDASSARRQAAYRARLAAGMGALVARSHEVAAPPEEPKETRP